MSDLLRQAEERAREQQEKGEDDASPPDAPGNEP